MFPRSGNLSQFSVSEENKSKLILGYLGQYVTSFLLIQVTQNFYFGTSTQILMPMSQSEYFNAYLRIGIHIISYLLKGIFEFLAFGCYQKQHHLNPYKFKVQELCQSMEQEWNSTTVSASLNRHLYKIQINHHFFTQKVHFLGLFWSNFGKISINHQLKTLIFLQTAGGLLTRIRYSKKCPKDLT